jgi:hypothetical protein
VSEGRQGPGPGGSPSPQAVQRLRRGVARRTEELRARTSSDLQLVDALVRAGAERAAAEALSDYERVLRAYAAELDRVVADAAVERAAEDALVATPGAAHDEPGALVLPLPVPEPPATAPSAAPAVAAEDEGAEVVPLPAARPGRRRSVAGALVAAMLAAAVVVPIARLPEGQLTSAEVEGRAELAQARQRLASLQSSPVVAPVTVTAHARDLHDRIFALPDAALQHEEVRAELRELLDLEQRALEDVAPHEPEALDLLEELRAIRLTLALDLPDGVRDPVGGVAEQLPEVRSPGTPVVVPTEAPTVQPPATEVLQEEPPTPDPLPPGLPQGGGDDPS